MEEESNSKSPAMSPPPCPSTITIRRNPHRRARPTPKTGGGLPSSSKPPLPDIPSFPVQDILSIELPENPIAFPGPSPAEAPKSENLKVYLRIRPIDFGESPNVASKHGASSKYGAKKWGVRSISRKLALSSKNHSCQICLTASSESSVTLSPPEDLQEAKRIKAEVFEGFSHVFCTDSSQNDVYEKMVEPLVWDFLRGTSGMLAALGPSGSGKTHTVFGTPREPGIVPLALQHIFGHTNDSTKNSKRSFFLSMFQICTERGKAEKAFDLSNGVELSMHQSGIKGLQEVAITDVGQAKSLIESGMLRRATAMTNSNSQSSRSQCIINIRDVRSRHDREVNIPASLTFVDLAGAEREKKTGNQGERLLESNFINNTSMVFGLCLRSLLEHQKNPKMPLQKHFQNSLLTRYLRDYLEGKKRMALILTVKPGGEDYLDTAQLLRQAAPLTKIKFTSAEVRNKRQITTLPRTEHAKRAKISRKEASVTKEEKSRSGKAGDAKRLDQPVLHFARAMWNVLNQYKQKLKVAGSEIESLRENLANEKTRILELEKELKNLKAGCNCINISPAEAPSERRNAYAEIDDSSSPEANEPSNCGSSNEVEGKVHSYLLPTPECNKMQDKCDSTLQRNDNIKCAVDFNYLHAQGHPDLNTHRKDHSMSTEDESVKVAPSVSSLESFDARAEQEYDVKVKKLAVDFSSSSESPQKAFDERDEKQHTKIKSAKPGGNEDSRGDLEDNTLDNLTLLSYGMQQHTEIKSAQPGGNEDSRGDLEDNTLDNLCGTENLKGFADTGSSILPHVLVRKESCSTVELDDLLSDGDEVSSDRPAEVSEDVASTQVSSLVNEPKKMLKPELSSKPPSPEKKPRRRLMPASSVLLKNMSYWSKDDETETPKGNKGGKRKDTTHEQRTQGSTALLRLLKGNLL